MIIHQDWLVQNSQRKYPLDDSATATADDDNLLPEDFIIDANIWVPKYLYSGSPERELQTLYISSAAVTPYLVSITILGSVLPAKPYGQPAPETPEQFVPIAVISMPKPIVPYKNYPVSPLLEGVSGWVAFGIAAADNRSFNLSFTKPVATMLSMKAVRTYEQAPVKSVSVLDGFSAVAGDVKLVGAEPLTVSTQLVNVNGTDRKALVFDLALDAEVLQNFAGKCGGAPESGTCNKQPILSMAGVTPDCEGFITMVVEGLNVRWLDDGLCMDSDVNIEDVCGEDDGLPNPDGTFKSEVTYERPCDLTIPYNMIPSDEILDSEFIPQTGSWYFDDTSNRIIGIPNYDGVWIATCISGWKTGLNYRKFTLGMVVHGYCEGGLYLMDEGLRQIRITTDGRVYKRSRSGEEISIGTGANVLDVRLSVDGTGLGKLVSGSVNYTFPAGDAYWQPSGACGAYIEGDPYVTGTYAEISTFGVSEAVI